MSGRERSGDGSRDLVPGSDGGRAETGGKNAAESGAEEKTEDEGDGGKPVVAEDHPPGVERPAQVALGTKDIAKWNTLVITATPVACWRIDDFFFLFDQTVVLPEARRAFAALHKKREQLTRVYQELGQGPPLLALFGHADPVGQDKYNKTLSEQRARAVYAVLIRDAALWKTIAESRDEGIECLQAHLLINGDLRTDDPSGKWDAETERAVTAYFDRICPDLKLEPKDFVGQGEFACQGCGEFNPLIMASQSQWNEFKKRENRLARDRYNEPNRRVLAFFFRPDTKPTPQSWPCPKAPDVTACEGQFVGDAADRRKFQARERTHQKDGNTFACGHYLRIAGLSPCEKEHEVVEDICLGFDGAFIYANICEREEVNRGGSVLAYREAQLHELLGEQQDRATQKKRGGGLTPAQEAECDRMINLAPHNYVASVHARVDAVVKITFSDRTPPMDEVHLGFEGSDAFLKHLEREEVNNAGSVMAYLREELESILYEIKDRAGQQLRRRDLTPEETKKLQAIVDRPDDEYVREAHERVTAVVKVTFEELGSAAEGNKKYRVTAEVIERQTSRVLLRESVEASRLVDRNGLWWLSGGSDSGGGPRAIWRLAESGKTEADFPHHKTKWVREPEGIDAQMGRLYGLLKGSFLNLTLRVRDLLDKARQRPYALDAEVRVPRTKEVLFEAHLETERLVDLNGLWVLSDPPAGAKRPMKIWRLAPANKTEIDFPNTKTRWVYGPQGLDKAAGDLYAMLRDGRPNITARVQEKLYGALKRR